MLHRPAICWVSGPWPAGNFSDLRIFRQDMKDALDVGEYVIADGTYADEKCLQPPRSTHSAYSQLSQIRARHENVNGRLKIFNVLNLKFRHGLHRHRNCFMAVVNITSLSLESEPLFHIHLDSTMPLE